MNLKPSFQYQLTDHLKSILFYYIIIICVFSVIICTTFVTVSSNVSFNGLEVATLVFLFVSGLCAFRENFLMLEQNSVSRKVIFYSRILTAVTICLIMAIIDKILLTIFAAVAMSSGDSIVVVSLFDLIYGANGGVVSSVGMQLIGFLFNFCFYITVFAFGYFITVLFYRLNKPGKVAVGVGVPVFLCIVLPILNSTLADGKIGRAYVKFVEFSMGLSAAGPANPAHAITSWLVYAAVFGLFSWLLLRRAVVK